MLSHPVALQANIEHMLPLFKNRVITLGYDQLRAFVFSQVIIAVYRPPRTHASQLR